MQPAARKVRDDPDGGLPFAAQWRQRAGQVQPRAGERIDDLEAAPTAQAATADLDARIQRLVLDDPLGTEPALGIGAARARPHPSGREQADENKRDAGNEQRRGVEHERDQDEHAAAEPDRDGASREHPRTTHAAH
jgi:hypothetical protein